jgi:aldehyde dehydrogenase (NAD+)
MTAIANVRTTPGAIPMVVKGLRQAYRSGRTRRRSFRLAQLDRLLAMLRERKHELLAALEADLGKSSFEGWLAEIALMEKEIAHTKKHLRDWMRPQKVKTPLALQPARCKVVSEPLGVVLIIAPWNYPLQLAILPLVGAIAAGNCAIVKPSEVAANTSRVIAELLPQYLDREFYAVVEGGVPETTALLEEKFDHIFYTGNGTIGRVVMAAAAKHLTPVTLELGGKSPVIVDASADLDVAARRIVWGKFFNAGQTCVAPDYVLVHRAAEERLIHKMTQAIRDFFGADPSHSKDYARIINERHHKRLTGLLADGTPACGGTHDIGSKYLAPTILRQVSPDSKLMAEEIFGPLLPVLPVDSLEQAVEFVNERPKPLALYVFTGSDHAARKVLRSTSSGGACVNDTMMHLTVPDLPFGGVGESGMGAYHGKTSFDTFSHRKSVLDKSVYLDLPLRYPPYDDTKAQWLKRLM